VNGNSGTKEIVQPELIVEAEFEIEEFWLPSCRVTTGELLVEADARWGTINLRERTLTRDAAIDADALAEGVANAGHLTCLVKAQIPCF